VRNKKIVIVGGGSAGFLTALALTRKMPQARIDVIHSSKIPVIGVGESTTRALPPFLHNYLGIDPVDFHKEVKPTFKRGVRFLWGSRDQFQYTFTGQVDRFEDGLSMANGFYCAEQFNFSDVSGALMAYEKAFETHEDGYPIIKPNVAYHLKNEAFVKYLGKLVSRSSVNLIDDIVESVNQDDDGIQSLLLKSGKVVEGDLFFDCSGFRSLLLGGALGQPFIDFSSSLKCDRAWVGGWERDNEPMHAYTIAETMNNGWAWQIDHVASIDRGYVFASEYVTDEEAAREFQQKNPKLKSCRLIKYKTGRYEKGWEKNVIGLGNAFGFVEPLEATAIAFICAQLEQLIDLLLEDGIPATPLSQKRYNGFCQRLWDNGRRFLALHYKFNNRLNTPFWKACRAETDLAGGEKIIAHFQRRGPAPLWTSEPSMEDDYFGWEGYLVMMLGQQVPFYRQYEIPEKERDTWNAHMDRLKSKARKAISMSEAFSRIQKDGLKWDEQLFSEAAALQKKNAAFMDGIPSAITQ